MIQTSRGTNIALVSAAVVVVLAGVHYAQAILLPFLLAVMFAILASAPIQWLRRHRVPNWLSIVIVLLGLILAIGGLAALVVKTIQEFRAQQDFYNDRLQEIAFFVITSLQGMGLPVSYDEFMSLFNPSRVLNFAGAAFASLTEMISNAFFIFLTMLFILAEGSNLFARLESSIKQLRLDTGWLQEFEENVQRYMAIKTVTSIGTGILVTILLSLIGVDFAVLWGVLAGLLNFVPTIGSIIAAAPAVLIALVQLGPGSMALTIVGYVVINIGVGTFLEPRFLGKQLGLSTLVVFLSLVFWGWMFGTIGMFMSVPLTIMAKLGLESSPATQWAATLLGDSADATEATTKDTTEEKEDE